MDKISVLFTTIGLLTSANVFMTFAWYGHLRFANHPLIIVILASWGIALFEYCLQVPANRIGHQYFSVVQLKTIQEVITMVVFIFFSTFYLGESLKLNQYIGLSLIVLGTYAVFYK
ncbi:MAG: DMT family protein [Gammaproteobacteria bacterium]|jgi:uncharacterized protein (DUF486 family)